MGLILQARSYPYQDRTAVAVDDTTQDYVEGDDGGWGVLGNPARSARCLIFWARAVAVDGSTSLISQLVGTQDTEGKIGIADGAGLANTDKSRFIISYGTDGHKIFYLLPVERDASRDPGLYTLGDVYYDTVLSKVYYHDGSSYVLVTSSNVSNLQSKAGLLVKEEIFDLNLRHMFNTKFRSLYGVTSGYSKTTKEELDELEAKILLIRAAFREGSKPTARKLIDSIPDLTI